MLPFPTKSPVTTAGLSSPGKLRPELRSIGSITSLGGEEFKPLRVNEVFSSIQGEAFYTGTAATFIRLQGCDVGCPWCDTKFTWSQAGQPVDLEVVLGKESSASPAWAWIGAEHLLGMMTRHTVFTGGEPAMQGETLGQLLDYIGDAGSPERMLHDLDEDMVVQIETSGTYPLNWCPGWVWVTVSPKLGMPGGRNVLLDALERANEIKMPVVSQEDVDYLLAMLDTLMPGRHERHIWLQPVEQYADATEICMAAAHKNPKLRVSFQVHKFVGLR
jgi:7-carboxy-7-deazaguanine synthase